MIFSIRFLVILLVGMMLISCGEEQATSSADDPAWLQKEHKNLEAAHAKMKATYTDLTTKDKEFREAYKAINQQAATKKLETMHGSIIEFYKVLLEEHGLLVADHEKIVSQHESGDLDSESAKSEHEKLAQEHESLLNQHNQAVAQHEEVAKKVKVLTEK